MIHLISNREKLMPENFRLGVRLNYPSFHIEERDNEIFLHNTTQQQFRPEYAPLKTLRFGTRSFDIHGKRLGDNYRPVFIDVIEYWELGKIDDKIITGSATNQ